jgi:hypothetical protein
MHDERSELAVFFDPACVAAAIRDALEDRNSNPAPDDPIPVLQNARPAAIDDHTVIRRLLPRELYDYWRDAGYTGMYRMTFLLRHAAAFLSLLAHEKTLPHHPDDGPASPAAFLKEHYPGRYKTADQGCLETLCQTSAPAQPGQEVYFPVIGFSSLGIHLVYRQAGQCRAFDYYDILCCPNRADGLFCPEHAAEAWWCDGIQKASTQADMFRFYGSSENISRYDEHDLQELVGRFWTHFKQTARLQNPGQGFIEEALDFFNYASLHELFEGGQLQLRRLYTQRARSLHPDAGGEHASFVQLQKYYEVLRTRMQYEQAGLF